MAYWSKRGSVTVFMGVILPVVIGACILLVDACLYDSGKRIIKNSVDASAYSILGKYSGYLKENYDLYAFCLGDETAKAIVRENINDNLGENPFFDFKIEHVEISIDGDIVRPEVLMPMLDKVATDDVYRSLTSEFTERFDLLSGVSSTAEIITLKMQLDKSYQKIKDSMTALKKIINGSDDLEYYVNLVGLDSEFAEAIELFNQYRFELKEIENHIYELTKEIDEEPSEKTGVKTLLLEQAGFLREKASEVYNAFIEGFINGLKDANKEALNHIRDIVLENDEIHILSQAIKNKVSKIEDCPGYMKELMYACVDLVQDVEEAFVEQVFEEIRIELDKNISALSELENIFNKTIEEGTPADSQLTNLNYNSSVYYSYIDEDKAGKEEDRRSFFESIGKRVLEKQIGEDVTIGQSILLPSDNFSSDTENFTATSLGQETSGSESEMSELVSGLSDYNSGFLDNLAVNEYILQHFGYENIKNKQLLQNRFFTNEVEYILWGNHSQNYNNFYTKAALMSTRFVLDAVHVYTDSEKSAKSDAIAAATAGWWTMGAGIPVMSNLVKISWSIAEAGIDTRKLWQGENLAIIKTAGDWVTDIGVGKKALSSPDFLKMDYEDYLRFYLIAVPMEEKLMRMMDIISLNSPGNFNINDAYTEITVTAVVSFRSFAGGRNEIEISTTRSY